MTLQQFWKLLGVLAGLGLWLAIVMIAQRANAAGSEGFIQPTTRVDGCVAIVDRVRDGSITPTEWLEQNKEEFEDLRLELRRRNYPAAKAKEMLMGMAITLCMERKGYDNTCVTARDEEKRDLQVIRTAAIGECWARPRRGDIPPPAQEPAPPYTPQPAQPVFIPPPPPPGPVLPPMSPADQQQFREDMTIITSPPTGVYPYGNQNERFASCTSYWQSLSYNRSPEARQVLYAVRVARCMYRTGFAVSHCPLDFNSMLQPQCYARF